MVISGFGVRPIVLPLLFLDFQKKRDARVR